jgi:hypothetical protein
MQEVKSALALQRNAYLKGREIKQAHVQAHCVVQEAELLALSGDFAHLLLFKELQRSGEIANPHERAGLRLQAFWQGYEDGHGGIEEASQV